MKVKIVYEFRDTAYGGANQFLKALKNYFVEKDIYTDNIDDADVVLFNSHNNVEELIGIKKKYPNKVYVHRVDGPTRLYSNPNTRRDFLAYGMNNILADGSIFQSQFSKNANMNMGMTQQKYETIISNAADKQIFWKKEKFLCNKELKTKIVAASFSSNWNKGFEVYKYLDEELDFDKYEMTFIGNSPIEFKNIRMMAPLTSKQLAEELRKNDIYITAAKKDPCSNALIEALSCGLPAVAYRDGGNPELVKRGGECFDEKEEIFGLLHMIEDNYMQYVNSIETSTIEEVGQKYLDFFQTIIADVIKEKYQPKRMTMMSTMKIYLINAWCKMKKV